MSAGENAGADRDGHHHPTDGRESHTAGEEASLPVAEAQTAGTWPAEQDQGAATRLVGAGGWEGGGGGAGEGGTGGALPAAVPQQEGAGAGAAGRGVL